MTPATALANPTAEATLYRISAQTATIAASPSRQDFQMPSHGTATQTANEEGLHRIGDVSRMTDVKPFVLRYWETEFPMLEPVKSARGHRLYREEDVDLVLKIKRLLYDEGFTIAGARRHLKELASCVGDAGDGGVHASSLGDAPTTQLSRKMLLDLRDGLRSFLTLLESK